MPLESLRDALPNYARDIKLNLSTVLTPEGSAGLSNSQIWGIALASAYATRSQALVRAIVAEAEPVLTAEELEAAQGAATIMAMNNIYYRSLHLAENEELSKLPARLRMQIIGKPGIAKVDFELYCLAVSAMAGCGMCIKSHVHETQKGGITLEGIQSVFRIAALIHAVAQALSIEESKEL